MRDQDLPRAVERAANDFAVRFGPDGVRPFAEEVRALRAQLGLTQEAFSRRYNIPIANLRNWEQAARNVKPDTAARLLIGMIKVDPDRVADLIARTAEAVTDNVRDPTTAGAGVA